MRESSTYQGILEEGAIEQTKKMILRLGRQKFDSPRDAVVAALRAITDLDRLDRMVDRVLNVSSWDELLATR